MKCESCFSAQEQSSGCDPCSSLKQKIAPGFGTHQVWKMSVLGNMLSYLNDTTCHVTSSFKFQDGKKLFRSVKETEYLLTDISKNWSTHLCGAKRYSYMTTCNTFKKHSFFFLFCFYHFSDGIKGNKKRKRKQADKHSIYRAGNLCPQKWHIIWNSTVKLGTFAAFHLCYEVGIPKFSSREYHLERHPGVVFPLYETSLVPTTKSKLAPVCLTSWKLYQYPVYRYFCLIFLSLNQSYTQYCPTSIFGHVAIVVACAKYNVIHGYQL